MLRYLAIVAVLMAAMSPIPGQAPKNPAGGSGTVQKQPKQGNANNQPAASTIPEGGTRPAQPYTEKPNAEDAGNSVTIRKLPTVSIGKDWADWSYWGFGGLLVIVGSLQVWLLGGTLVAVKWQARETKRAAEAALLNAQAVINAERPWLVAHLKEFKEAPIPNDGRLRLAWEVKNVGKTPAKLIEADAVAVFNLDAVPLPDVPIYGYFPETLENRMLVPGDTYSFWAHWYELKEGRYIRLEKQNIGPRADLLVVFGYVKYRDTFDSTKEHVSRFCDCTFISGSKVGGHVSAWDSAPAEYTECT